MATVFDVAKYILLHTGPITTMKLQKLVYYSQAWSLVWDDRSMFDEPIEAWVNGPVVPALYQAHRGAYIINADVISGDIDQLDITARETIDAVLSGYGEKSAQWLIDLTHAEDPWIIARNGLPAGVPCNNEIKLADMAEYYSSLLTPQNGQ
jgi:uncharacterized phage-associated protein